MPKNNAGPGVYSATYSNIPVWEYQFGADLKEHVMRRRQDNWINATHILKAAGFDKPARTRILEREVQKELHEKVQGGYGKYQGTWVPLPQGEALAVRNDVFEKLRPIFEFSPGEESPPPAPKHTTNKPKVPKKPAVPKFNHHHSNSRAGEEMFDNISEQLHDDDSVDFEGDTMASFMEEEDRYDMSQQSTGHRKRKRDDPAQEVRSVDEQNHAIWADELLDFFFCSATTDDENKDKKLPLQRLHRPEPPLNFQPQWPVDPEYHTAMHWAAATGDVESMKQMKRFNADNASRNIRSETPLMRAVMFSNCYDKQVMPKVLQELINTLDLQCSFNSTVLHHATANATTRHKQMCARYYLDVILNKMSELFDQEHIQQLLDMQDNAGDTALHIAIRNKARKCIKALLGRHASTDIPNGAGITSADMLIEFNQEKEMRRERTMQASSSPFAPDSNRRISFHEPPVEDVVPRRTMAHTSEAAMSVESKITPLILEKFQKLAYSFDEELTELEQSQMEAHRIHTSAQAELVKASQDIARLEAEELRAQNQPFDDGSVIRAKSQISSIVEMQQELLINKAVQKQENLNGHLEDTSPDAKLDLYNQLEAAQKRRRGLIEEYFEAVADLSLSEQGDMYRKLTAKCVGITEEEVDPLIDSLLIQLQENQVDFMTNAPDTVMFD